MILTSAFRSKRTFGLHLHLALNSLLPYLLHLSLRWLSPNPTLPFFGSQERKRRTIAGEAQKAEDCCGEEIIAWNAKFMTD